MVESQLIPTQNSVKLFSSNVSLANESFRSFRSSSCLSLWGSPHKDSQRCNSSCSRMLFFSKGSSSPLLSCDSDSLSNLAMFTVFTFLSQFWSLAINTLRLSWKLKIIFPRPWPVVSADFAVKKCQQEMPVIHAIVFLCNAAEGHVSWISKKCWTFVASSKSRRRTFPFGSPMYSSVE